MENSDVIKICKAISTCIESDGVVIPREKKDCVEIVDGMKIVIEIFEENEKLKEQIKHLANVNGSLVRMNDKLNRGSVK